MSVVNYMFKNKFEVHSQKWDCHCIIYITHCIQVTWSIIKNKEITISINVYNI